MRITVDDTTITIAGHSFKYGTYYFDSEEFARLRPSEIMKKVIGQWRTALENNPGDGRTFFLPFELDDECVECILASSEHDTLTLRYIWADENGYTVFINDLIDFILAPHGIQREFQELGKYSRTEFISALSAVSDK